MLPTTAITRVELSSGLREFDLEASRLGFIGGYLAVPVSVGRQSGNYGYVPTEQLLGQGALANIRRAPQSGYNRASFTFSTASFACQEYGAEEPVDDALLKIYSDVLDAEAVARERVVDRVLRPFEVAAASLIYDAATFTEANGRQTAIVEEWDDPQNAAPIDDIQAARQAIWDRTGTYPNVLAVNGPQFDALRTCEQIIDRIAYGGGPRDPAVVTAAALAQIFGVERVIVGSGAVNAAAEGQAADIDPIWSGEYAMLARCAVSGDIAENCLARSFFWPEDGALAGDGGQAAVLIEEYREEAVRGSVLRARTYWDLKLINADCGHLFSNVLTL